MTPLDLPLSSPELKWALARVTPPADAHLSCIWAADSRPDGWENVPPSVRAW